MDRPGRLDAVEYRHLEIHQHHVGGQLPAECDSLGAVRCGADELEVRLRHDHAAEPIAQHTVVVGDHHARHRAGTSSSTVVPSPAAERIRSSRPPAHELFEQRETEMALVDALLAPRD